MQNFSFLESEIQWFSQFLQARLEHQLSKTSSTLPLRVAMPPSVAGVANSNYAATIAQYQMTWIERLVLLLTLLPHLRPEILDWFFVKNPTTDRPYSEFGGVKGNQHTGFLPTGETAAFLVAGNDLALRAKVLDLFTPDHYFYKANLLRVQTTDNDSEPFLSGKLTISKEYLALLLTGKAYEPTYSPQFPAQKLHTALTWDDLVLDDEVREQIDYIRTWLTHSHTLMETWGMKRILKAGFRCLFYGVSGTGKTLTASLIGKTANLPVYRVDLSMLVSKYIGETEKNLAFVFEQAENKNWVLFFDEADALFGKRTQTNSSNDRHANQEVAYLLQRIEDFNGLVILATNLKGNIDEAFARRFQAMIHFPMPSAAQRLILWQNTFSPATVFEPTINLQQIAQQYELAGGSIINVVQYCSLKALQNNSNQITAEDLLAGIKRELRKEGKMV